MKLQPKLGKNWLGGLIGALLAVALGLILLDRTIGGGLIRLSFDLPFALRHNVPVDEVVLLFIDEESHGKLHQLYGQPWDRRLHAQLVDCLRSNQCRAVVFDIIFSNPHTNPAVDEQLGKSIKDHGNVILAADYVLYEPVPGLPAKTADLPFEKLRQSAAGWGNAKLFYDPDFGVRRHFPNITGVEGYPSFPTLAWSAALAVGAPVTTNSAFTTGDRWLNFYGPPDKIPHFSYHMLFESNAVQRALLENKVKNKVVFIGERLTTGFTGEKREMFVVPYSRWGKGFSSGVELHATAFLNLVRGDWLQRLPAAFERFIFCLIGLASGFGLIRCQPLRAIGVAVAGVMVIAAAACMLVWYQRYWLPWLIPVAVQIPVALVWAVAFNSLQSFIQRQVLQRSLGFYLAPSRVKYVMSNPELLKPDAKEETVSILFTDIANFSKITERTLAKDLVPLLNDYFQAAIPCIHQTHGTVVKLIGDAIFAVWNAPEPQDRHQELACQAVLKLQEALRQFDARHRGLSFRTRAGLHSGKAFVGNFGSTERFDYTAIGDSVNLASRLEGLNKYLGTDVLVSDEFHDAIKGCFVTRLAGHFKFKGFDKIVVVHELIGGRDASEGTRGWREAFADALAKYQRRQFQAAEKGFGKAIELRRQSQPTADPADVPPDDGPSRFYLDHIQYLQTHPPGADWMGEVVLEGK